MKLASGNTRVPNAVWPTYSILGLMIYIELFAKGRIGGDFLSLFNAAHDRLAKIIIKLQTSFALSTPLSSSFTFFPFLKWQQFLQCIFINLLFPTRAVSTQCGGRSPDFTGELGTEKIL